jgi:hypothetical protein
MGGRIQPEQVAEFNRNGWPDSTGMHGRIAPEYARAPALTAVGRHRRGAAMQRQVLAAFDPHADLQPIEAIQASHALPIDSPACQ